MRFIVLVLTAMLWASALYAQSVPNGMNIIPGQVWTVPQWLNAWQSKVDLTNGMSRNQTLNTPILNNPTLNGATYGGSITFPGGLVSSGTSTLSGGGSLDGTWAGAPVFTGNPTFTGQPFFTAYNLSNASGTIASGGAAQSLLILDNSRKGCSVQNLSTMDLWVSNVGTASASQPSQWVPPGSEWSCPFNTATAAISIFGSVTGQAFTARAWQ